MEEPRIEQNPYYGDLRFVRPPKVKPTECPNGHGKLERTARFFLECKKCDFGYSEIGGLA